MYKFFYSFKVKGKEYEKFPDVFSEHFFKVTAIDYARNKDHFELLSGNGDVRVIPISLVQEIEMICIDERDVDCNEND